MRSFAAHISLFSFISLIVCLFGMEGGHITWTEARISIMYGLFTLTLVSFIGWVVGTWNQR